METFFADNYDIIVIGAGHAGCESSLASARLNKKTLMLTINLDSIAMMPCNPSIGGTGKGHLVREIDALGGQMGINIDKTFIQSKMLNIAKGPAVHSLRAQADKNKYHTEMKSVIENTEFLDVKQAEVIELILENDKVIGVITATGSIYKAKAVILATGTYLGGKIFIGSATFSSGPNGLSPSIKLTDNLKDIKIDMRRFKTGTPARVNSRTLNYNNMVEQAGDKKIVPFSFMSDKLDIEQVSCWLTYTNNDTHDIIIKNLHRSALFSGEIEGIGPRYCPSIEDKINRFSDKDRHQLFIEPEGLSTNEMYVQGMSTSMPEDVQIAFMKTIPGLENVEIMRPAYAIEYDCIDPTQLELSLEFRHIDGLFSAGQFNGSSGYEEAAAQGLIAGINASLKIDGKKPFIIDRSEGYIGVLIDDLVTKGTNEPYRMMTSRCEYRLLLRQDNADMRLTEKSYKIGLASKERYNKLVDKLDKMEKEFNRMSNTLIKAKDINGYLKSIGSSELRDSITILNILKRPEIFYDQIGDFDLTRPELREDVWKQCEISIKYEGYISKQLKQVEKFKKLENKKIRDIDYNDVSGLRIEAKQKLIEIKPSSLGQASRISGVSPADISVLLIYMDYKRRSKKNEK